MSTFKTVTGASNLEANFTFRWTELEPCAHMTAQLIVASSIFVWRIKANNAPDWSRISVTARRASAPGGTFCARSTSTAFFAADHQCRCELATINASRGAELSSSLLLLLIVLPLLLSS